MFSLRVARLAVCALLLPACGGLVVFQEDGGEGGDGGTGAAGPGPGPGPGPGSTTGSMNSSTGTGPMQTPCDLLCAQFPECFPDGSCLEQCKNIYFPGCEPETDAFLLCLLGVLEPGCEFTEDACFEEGQAVEQCQDPDPSDCQTDSCDKFSGGCNCWGECFDTPVEEYCYLNFGPDGDPGPPPPQVTCDCVINAEFIGSCQMNEVLCDLDQGCCKNFFLDGGG